MPRPQHLQFTAVLGLIVYQFYAVDRRLWPYVPGTELRRQPDPAASMGALPAAVHLRLS